MEMVLEIVDMLLFPIAEPIKIILDAILKLVELIVTLVTAIPQILMAALQIFDPVSILNDVIAGTFLGLKLIIKSVADIFSSGPNFKYNKCKDTGEGLFGFRRNRDSKFGINYFMSTIITFSPSRNTWLVSYYSMCFSYN